MAQYGVTIAFVIEGSNEEDAQAVSDRLTTMPGVIDACIEDGPSEIEESSDDDDDE